MLVVPLNMPVIFDVAHNLASSTVIVATCQLIQLAQVLPTNHDYHPISINSITIAEYRKQLWLG